MLRLHILFYPSNNSGPVNVKVDGFALFEQFFPLMLKQCTRKLEL